MKSFLILLLCVAALASDLVVTKEYVEYLKKTVDWEVMDYEDNIFKGWTIQDVQQMLGLNDQTDGLDNVPEVEYEPLPSSINWAGAACDHGVRNQGACGSCWAFAISGMLADRCCIQSSDRGLLSPQEMISCDTGSFGCYGGNLDRPVQYIQRVGGLVRDSCYPYKAKKETCPKTCVTGGAFSSSHVCKCNKVVSCSGTMGIKSCLKRGPVPIGFSVCQSFMSYKSGIYKCDCTNYIGGHAVEVMGSSDTPSCNYYIKNSWGTYWGIKGYFNMDCSTCNLSGGNVCDSITA